MHTKVKKEVRRLNRIIVKKKKAKNGVKYQELLLKQHKQEQRIKEAQEQYEPNTNNTRPI